MKAAFFLKGVTLGLEFSALYTNLKFSRRVWWSPELTKYWNMDPTLKYGYYINIESPFIRNQRIMYTIYRWHGVELLLFFFKYNHSCMVVNLLVYMETSVVSSSAPAIMFRYQLILFLIVVFFGFPGLKGM